jgi:hypothetical protein
MILLQLFIMISGNLSFLNWLTVIPALACLDDTFWQRILPRRLVSKAETARQNAEESKPLLITSYMVAVVLAILSIQPAFNLLSPTQVMNSSFDPLELVKTYGAFGSVGQERLNVVFEGTAEDTTGGMAHWKSYIYKGLPVLLDKRPPQVAPYQLRLDWQMWLLQCRQPANIHGPIIWFGNCCITTLMPSACSRETRLLANLRNSSVQPYTVTGWPNRIRRETIGRANASVIGCRCFRPVIPG